MRTCKLRHICLRLSLNMERVFVFMKLQCLGQVICNDLSDEADIQSKVRLLYAKSNMLHKKFHLCFTVMKK